MREEVARKARQVVGSVPPSKEARDTCTQQDSRKSQSALEPVPGDQQSQGVFTLHDPDGKELPLDANGRKKSRLAEGCVIL